ncbi:hypothetical protein RHDC4_02205 [Rhodocyclaceae bacterium]|nr:hypothetical protein RHDC4_02205 [Rhodocyclaceae bacterium]
MRYVYPVVSRRSGGVSVGINLNPNNACNWRCIYCQVPGLTRGGPPPLDASLLDRELRTMLAEVLHGSFLGDHVPEGARQLSDVAFSGNGEPTSAVEFPQAVGIATHAMRDAGIGDSVRLRLITNGSLLDRRSVKDGIARLGQAGGEVWFKLDAATDEAIRRVNGTRSGPASALRRLSTCTELCDTWVQSCFFLLDGNPPSEHDLLVYLDALDIVKGRIKGVHLYGLARPPMQMDASRLGRLSAGWLEMLAARIGRLGLTVKVSP